MRPTIFIGENKGADQLRSNCEADQRLCFRYTDNTIPFFFTHKLNLYVVFLASKLIDARLECLNSINFYCEMGTFIFSVS